MSDKRLASNNQAIEKEVLRRMVTSFRVQELQQLMALCNRSRVGKKQELQSRALYLIKNNSETKDCKVANAIRDIYNRRYPPRQMQMMDPTVISSMTVPGYSSVMDPGDASKSYTVSSGSESSSDKQQVPVLPDVTFKDLPFYEEIDVLIKPTSMMDQGPSRYQETTIPFYLSQRQVQAIYDSRTIQPLQGGNVISYNYLVQIQVRLCLLETSCEQADHFPAFLSLKVNGSQAYSFQEPQSSNVKRPPSVPIDITAHCRLSSAYPNALSVTWAANYGQRHCIVVRLVRQHNSQMLLDRLKKHIRNIDHSKALIKEKLSCDDNEIATTSLRVSLLCPLSKARIQIPCRPTTCNHLQCFDASIFLQMNEKKATWQCPVCDGAAKYPTLAIDAFFKLIISQSSDADEIEVFPDGSWKALVNKPDPVQQETKTKLEAISVDSPESECSAAVPSTSGVGAPVHDVIDILSSDDEECAPPPSKKVAVHQTSVIRSNPKPPEPVMPQDPAVVGYEALLSMCQNSIPNADPAFTNFIRELHKMRQYHRTQMDQQPAQVSPQQQQHQPSRSSRDSENIITID